MLIQKAHRHLIILTVTILKAFAHFLQGFTWDDHLLADRANVLAFALDRGQPMAIGCHHRYLSFLQDQKRAAQCKAGFILGSTKSRFHDHFPEHRGWERQVFSALKGGERWEILSRETWNAEKAAPGC